MDQMLRLAATKYVKTVTQDDKANIASAVSKLGLKPRLAWQRRSWRLVVDQVKEGVTKMDILDALAKAGFLGPSGHELDQSSGSMGSLGANGGLPKFEIQLYYKRPEN